MIITTITKECFKLLFNLSKCKLFNVKKKQKHELKRKFRLNCNLTQLLTINSKLKSQTTEGVI